jgi:hypothetical protein
VSTKEHADGKRLRANPSVPTSSRRLRAPRIGRRVGIAVFWALAVFVVGASAWSIIPSLYFPGVAPLPEPASVAECRDELAALEAELSERSAENLARRAASHHDEWLHDWDRRIALLDNEVCGPLKGARNDLSAARAALGEMLQRYANDVAPAQRKVRAALDALARVPKPPPHG